MPRAAISSGQGVSIRGLWEQQRQGLVADVGSEAFNRQSLSLDREKPPRGAPRTGSAHTRRSDGRTSRMSQGNRAREERCRESKVTSDVALGGRLKRVGRGMEKGKERRRRRMRPRKWVWAQSQVTRNSKGNEGTSVGSKRAEAQSGSAHKTHQQGQRPRKRKRRRATAGTRARTRRVRTHRQSTE
jgi:hypothetical protein